MYLHVGEMDERRLRAKKKTVQLEGGHALGTVIDTYVCTYIVHTYRCIPDKYIAISRYLYVPRYLPTCKCLCTYVDTCTM